MEMRDLVTRQTRERAHTHTHTQAYVLAQKWHVGLIVTSSVQLSPPSSSSMIMPDFHSASGVAVQTRMTQWHTHTHTHTQNHTHKHTHKAVTQPTFGSLALWTALRVLQLPSSTHTHTHTHATSAVLQMHRYVCVCVCADEGGGGLGVESSHPLMSTISVRWSESLFN